MVLITSSCLVRAGVGAGNLHGRTHRSGPNKSTQCTAHSYTSMRQYVLSPFSFRECLGSICLTGLGTPSRARSGRPNHQAVYAGQGFGQTAGNPSPQKSNKKVCLGMNCNLHSCNNREPSVQLITPLQRCVHGRPPAQVSRLQQNLGQNDDEDTASSAQEATTQDWMEVPDLDVRSAFLSKPIKAASLPGGRVLMFYKARKVSPMWREGWASRCLRWAGVKSHPEIPGGFTYLVFPAPRLVRPSSVPQPTPQPSSTLWQMQA